jgi:probable F420-dependent oxidoreductase
MALIREFVTRADELAYDSLWLTEEVLGGAPALEASTLLAYVAALTQRVRIGVAVMVLARHNPILLAKTLASLDFMSNGRLNVGVGLGQEGVERVLGYSGERRLLRFNEALAVMKALWTQPAASFDGVFWSFTEQKLWPRPVQQPYPPIWFGAKSTAALKRTVEQGDGFVGSGVVTPAQFAAQVALLHEHLAAAGRSPATFPISKRVYIAVDHKAERAERRLRGWFSLHYGNPDLIETVAVWGDPDRCVAQLQALVHAGATHLLLNPVYNEMEHMEVLAEEIMPRLQGSGAPMQQ